MGDRANKFIGLLSERYTGLSLGSRAPSRVARDGKRHEAREREAKRRRISRGKARKIVKTLYKSAERRYSGHPDEGRARKRDKERKRGKGKQREALTGVSAGEIQ